MTFFYIFLGGVAALVILYMTYPRFKRKRLSSARFFRDLPPPKKGQSRLRTGKLQFTLSFFLQLLVFLALLAAAYWMVLQLDPGETSGLGVWIFVDTSASMSTMQDGRPRMDAALEELERAVAEAEDAAEGKDICFRLSALDLEQRDILEKSDAASILLAARKLAPRPLGTDAGIIRRVLSFPDIPGASRCRVSHILVITDLPAPGWLGESAHFPVVWRDIAKPVYNVGFTRIRASRNPLTGQTTEVLVEITAFGKNPRHVNFTVTGPGEDVVLREPIDWKFGKVWHGEFTPPYPGDYRLELSNGGEYTYDDSALITIKQENEIRVDWQLPNRSLPKLLGWVQDKKTPQLRVTADASVSGTVPTLIVGPGYPGRGYRKDRAVEIRDFMESSPVLNDVNFDAVEFMGLPGIEVPEDFKPVIRGVDGTVWMAQSMELKRAVVPGLPTGRPGVTGNFSSTVFFNALRWLLRERVVKPLITLTSPLRPQPAANRLAIHPGEGNTQLENQSSGRLEDLTPATGLGTADPVWPILLMAALLLFLIERSYQLFKKFG